MVRETAGGSRSPLREQGPGLRPGEVRALEHHSQQREQRRRERLEQRRAESARRSEQQQYCRNLRDDMHSTRDHSRRKHLAGKLRRDCW